MADILNSIVVNPIKKIGSVLIRSSSSKTETVEKVIIKHEYEKLPVLGFKNLANSSKVFLRLAALSGAAAVVASAYGSHGRTVFFSKLLLLSSILKFLIKDKKQLKT